jgi:integrase/recombinase XerD
MPREQSPPKTEVAPPTPLAAALDAHLAALASRHYAVTTLTVRRVHLRQFCAWATARDLTTPDALTRPILTRYQRHLFHCRKRNGQPLSLASQHARLTHLRVWCQWLTKQHALPHNPAAELELPRLGSPLPGVLSAAEAEQVLQQPALATPVGFRDRALLEVLYSTGLRRMELVRLAVSAVDRVRGLVTVRQGKGRKERVVPIGERALAWLDKYLWEVRPRWVGESDAGIVFLTTQGNPFCPNHLSALVRRYVAAARLGKRGACHLFRHTMATVMLEGGADIRFIQQMLGHAKLTTTQLYTHVSIPQLQAVHAATHPAARLRHRPRPGPPDAGEVAAVPEVEDAVPE